MAIQKSEVKLHKRRFDRELRHIKIILAHERQRIPIVDWLHLVEATKRCILDAPEDFFCGELPPKPVISAVVQKVFEGFLEDQRLLSLQKSNIWWTPGR